MGMRVFHIVYAILAIVIGASIFGGGYYVMKGEWNWDEAPPIMVPGIIFGALAGGVKILKDAERSRTPKQTTLERLQEEIEARKIAQSSQSGGEKTPSEMGEIAETQKTEEDSEEHSALGSLTDKTEIKGKICGEAFTEEKQAEAGGKPFAPTPIAGSEETEKKPSVNAAKPSEKMKDKPSEELKAIEKRIPVLQKETGETAETQKTEADSKGHPFLGSLAAKTEIKGKLGGEASPIMETEETGNKMSTSIIKQAEAIAYELVEELKAIENMPTSKEEEDELAEELKAIERLKDAEQR
jgi:hypothetical protein